MNINSKKQREITNDVAKYFEKISIDPSKNLIGEVQLTQLFYLIMAEYREFEINADELSRLFEKLYMLAKVNDTILGSSIFEIISDLAELDWQLRHEPQEAGELLQKAVSKYEEIMQGMGDTDSL
jgi:hypothetical protein